jgi:hypothetical protein
MLQALINGLEKLKGAVASFDATMSGSSHGSGIFSHLSGSLILLLIFSFAFIAVVAYIFVYKPRKPAETEGFAVLAPPLGANVAKCSIPELDNIVQQFAGKDSDDAREFAVLAGKLGCMKADLKSDAGLIHASANQPFVSTHDRQPVTETLTQCFSKSAPARDLELVFDLYMSRGEELIKRIGGEAGIDCNSMIGVYKKVVDDIYDIAKGRCLANVSEGKLKDFNGVSQGDFAAYELGGASL